MHHARYIRWLYDELPALTDRGVLDAAAAERLRRHYGQPPRTGSRVALAVFAILGALLVGAGVILLLAHNWEDLSRELRAALAFLPLLAAQAIAWRVRRRPAPTRGALEGAALFLSLMVAAAIALVGQTYQIQGDLETFLLTWALLALPLAYLYRSTAVLVLYLAAITGWCGCLRFEEQSTLPYLGLFLAALPFFILEARRGRQSLAVMLGGLALGLAALAGTAIRLDWDWYGLWILHFSTVLAAFYLAGTYWFPEAAGARNPLRNLGALGIGYLAFALSFEYVWKAALTLPRGRVPMEFWNHPNLLAGAFPEFCLLLVLAIALATLLVSQRRFAPLVLGSFPVLALAGYAVAAQPAATAAAVLFNIYGFGAGLFLLISGIRAGRLGVANLGLVWVLAIIVARFLDLDFSFVVKGVVFILLGAGFLATNLLLAKIMRRARS